MSGTVGVLSSLGIIWGWLANKFFPAMFSFIALLMIFFVVVKPELDRRRDEMQKVNRALLELKTKIESPNSPQQYDAVDH